MQHTASAQRVCRTLEFILDGDQLLLNADLALVAARRLTQVDGADGKVVKELYHGGMVTSAAHTIVWNEASCSVPGSAFGLP